MQCDILYFQVFCSGEVRYAGQPLGIIVAESQTLAASAVSKVKVHYGNLKKPYIGIREAIASGNKSRIRKVKELAEVKMGGKFTES
jgi:CO/xanthine dehydrogenase Mo-binding subunit